jgi:uncharacterized protein
VINIEDFALAQPDSYLPNQLSPNALVLWTIMRTLFEGKMRAIFSMLFGASVVLLSSRLERRGEAANAADVYLRRTLWLLAFGLLHAYFLWEGDILFSYALCGILLFPFRKMKSAGLVVLGAFVLFLSTPRAALMASDRQTLLAAALEADRNQAAGKNLSQKLTRAQCEWAELNEDFQLDAQGAADMKEDYLGGYAGLFWRRAPTVVVAESWDFYTRSFTDVGGMMLLGMGLLKLGVLSATRTRRFYILLSALGLGLGLPTSALIAYENYLHRFDPAAIVWLKAASDPARLCLALGYIGLVMLLVQARGAERLKLALGDAGRMALSNYLTATIVCTTVFNGYGFGFFASLERNQLYLVVLGVWCLQLLFSHFWLRAYRFGPVEWVWRSLSYWRVQTLSRG